MDVAKKYEQLKSLRALAENPSTPEAEAENARARIDEIEQKIRREHEESLENERKNREERAKRRTGKKLSIANLRARKGKGKVERFETEWPFGWDRRDTIHVSEISFPLEKKIVLEWKCPSCEMHVERTITPRHRARLMGKPGGVRKFVGDIRGGKLNQLCDECWRKYQ